jgi:hypothetical protein
MSPIETDAHEQRSRSPWAFGPPFPPPKGRTARSRWRETRAEHRPALISRPPPPRPRTDSHTIVHSGPRRTTPPGSAQARDPCAHRRAIGPAGMGPPRTRYGCQCTQQARRREGDPSSTRLVASFLVGSIRLAGPAPNAWNTSSARTPCRTRPGAGQAQRHPQTGPSTGPDRIASVAPAGWPSPKSTQDRPITTGVQDRGDTNL